MSTRRQTSENAVILMGPAVKGALPNVADACLVAIALLERELGENGASDTCSFRLRHRHSQ